MERTLKWIEKWKGSNTNTDTSFVTGDKHTAMEEQAVSIGQDNWQSTGEPVPNALKNSLTTLG